ncbi:hypothetical protein [Profundibacter sp.]
MQIKYLALVAALVISLAGCLDNDVERAAAGAVAGAVVVGAAGGSLLTGAVIGAGAGALCNDIGVCN